MVSFLGSLGIKYRADVGLDTIYIKLDKVIDLLLFRPNLFNQLGYVSILVNFVLVIFLEVGRGDH